MSHQQEPDNRPPLVIEQGSITAGRHTAAVDGDCDHEIVRSYLRLIRRARGEWRHRTIAVRRADVAILAEHLGWSEQQVLGELADLVGSSRRQRAAMFALLATGASLITIAEPVAAAPGMGPTDAPPVVIEVPELQGLKTGPHGAAQHDPATSAPGHASAERPAVQERAERSQSDSPPSGVGSSAAPAPPVQPAEAAPSTEPVETAATSETATIDGATVAVGQPPVPPATDDDGNAVAVGQPPVPPAVDDDGNAVAVGQPPVPAPTDG